jgi:thiaminase/transcriptional activator TenA
VIVPPFAARLRAAADAPWRASATHPFVAALADATLDAARFRFYQMQDARYLEAFADGCAIVATRVADPADKIWWLEAARLALVVERDMHQEYGKSLGYGAADIAALELTPNCHAYTKHMLATAHAGSLVEAIAALVPCPWVYVDLGTTLLERLGGAIPDDHPYANWLRMYSDPAFDEYMTIMLRQLQAAADASGPAEQARAEAAFVASVRYEWMFWEQAWTQQRWPV